MATEACRPEAPSPAAADAPVAVRRAAAAALVASLLASAACSTGLATPEREDLTWTEVEVPAGFAPSVLAPEPSGGLLVGSDGAGGGGHPPRLAVLHAGAGFVEVPVDATTYYGARARWTGVVAGDRVYGLGGRSGGAHANVRWTAWSGTRTALREDPQTFETFGGVRAGGLESLVLAGDAPVVVGSWTSDAGGLEVATWTFHGRRWVRQPSTGTALASSEDRQASVRGAAARGPRGVLVLGAATVFGHGEVRMGASAWAASAPEGPWTRVDLPAPEGTAIAEAHAATCDQDGSCLVTGVIDGRLALWTLTSAGTPSLVAHAPRPALPSGATVPAPVRVGPTWFVLVPGDAGRPAELLVGDGGTWAEAPAPDGVVRGFAAAGGRLYVTTAADGRSSLWSTEVAERPQA